MPNILATAVVPPRASIICESFMPQILGSPKGNVKAHLIIFMLGLPTMKTWNQRLSDRLKEIGMKPSELARRVGVSAASVSDWEKGVIKTIKGANLIKAAKALGIDPDWLLTGRHSDNEHHNANILDHAPPVNKVPLVSWVRAGTATVAEDPTAPGYAEDWITTTTQVRDHTFALRVRGDSMEPEFPEGVIIIVEPDMQFENGDYVVVRNSHDEATFKQLIQDGGDWYLKPVNPRYPIKPLGDARVVGVVRESVKKYR